MLELKEIEEPIITNQYLLEFDGYYGDMDYDYNKEFYIEANDQNKTIIEEVLKKLPKQPAGCSDSQDFTEEINEILEKIEDEDVYICADENSWYPSWNLGIYYFDENGKKWEVEYKEEANV